MLRFSWLLVSVLTAIVVIGVVFAVILIRDSGAAPAGTPLVGEDSGVAACKEIAKDNKIAGKSGDDKMTEKEYKDIRKLFSDSSDKKIRENGTKIIDIAWQVQGMGDDAGLAALPLIGDLVSAYTGLAGGCADHGIVIPPLSTS